MSQLIYYIDVENIDFSILFSYSIAFLNFFMDRINSHKPGINFRDIGVALWLTKQLEELNIRNPTPVQTNCIPKILQGSDVLGCAKTGTGKTLAFVLPLLQQVCFLYILDVSVEWQFLFKNHIKLSTDPFGIFALVLTPTRELAFQIGDQFNALGKQMNLKCSVIVGGRHQMIQAQELARRPHIVVATPGFIWNYRANFLLQNIQEDLMTIYKVIHKVSLVF